MHAVQRVTPQRVQLKNKSSTATSAYRPSDTSLDVRPITPAIGAEIHDIRLSGELPAETVTAIRDALLRHRVVFFREQSHLDETEHQAFARLLGPIVPHPTIPSVAGTEAVLDIDDENGRASYWHTETRYRSAKDTITGSWSATLCAGGRSGLAARTVRRRA
jgi:alpha-ketoglutarate-dependent sulfate ester dioxygenase